MINFRVRKRTLAIPRGLQLATRRTGSAGASPAIQSLISDGRFYRPAVAEKDSSSGPVPGEKAEHCTDQDERRGKNESVAHLEGYPGHGGEYDRRQFGLKY